MNKLAQVVGIAGVVASSLVQAADWDNKEVLTIDGVVKFVPENITATELSGILYPVKQKTRSLFDSEDVTEAVSVAMLIQFEFDSSSLTEASQERLNTLGVVLNSERAAGKKLMIEGHTDISGSDSYNLRLSFKRAESVKRYLMEYHNIESDRMEINGMGEKELINPSEPKGSVNRRVQFTGSK